VRRPRARRTPPRPRCTLALRCSCQLSNTCCNLYKHIRDQWKHCGSSIFFLQYCMTV
jgi:hypothetical protein